MLGYGAMELRGARTSTLGTDGYPVAA